MDNQNYLLILGETIYVQMNKTFFGHPRGLSTLFFTEVWERFSFYGMRAILILYMTTDRVQEGLGLSTEDAGAAYGLYTMSVYLLSLPGGWLADNIFGQRRAVWYGGILIMIGHAILAIPANPQVFFLGLAFVAMGTGLLKPNVSTMVGDLYSENEGAKRDAGFSLFYMGINIGSILGQFIVPFLAEKINWHLGFGMAAIGMLVGLIHYRMTETDTLGSIGIIPKAKESIEQKKPTPAVFQWGIPALLAIVLAYLQFSGQINLASVTGIASASKYLIVLVTVFYFIYIIIAGGLTDAERKRVYVIFILFIGAAMFWSGFEQAGSALNLFARDFTNLNVFGWDMPVGWLQTVNPIVVVLFAPIIGALWIKLAARNINPRTPIKFAAGLFMLAIGFLVMVQAAQVATSGAKAGMFFLVLTYFFHSIGELVLSPVGLSATTKLAPKAYVGQMMGIWFVATSLGNLIAGTFGGNFDPENVQQMPNMFLTFVQMPIAIGIIFLVLSPFMRKWMGNIQ